MRDSEVVASIVAGDALGLAAAYDRYAEPLFQYCRSLLANSADAADAVQDTFVIAAGRLDRLRDPDRLRPWLYAVARNEARRILRSAKGTSALDEAPDMTDDPGDIAADAARVDAARVDLRALLEDAAAGLNPGDRELIELQLRQGLETAEVATVLGVSRNHAQALLARATRQLETCLAALLVGRAGGGECGELGGLLDGWDGRLTILLRKRVHRHIEHCPTCTARRASELRPAMLLDLSPGAALAAGAAASLRLARGAPAGLREHTITLATGPGAGAVAHRAAVLSRAGAFTGSGFPRPGHGAKAAFAAFAAFAAHGGPGGGPGALSVYPQGRMLVLEPNGPGRQIDLGGGGAGDWYVTWSVAVANDPENAISLSPASGTLTSADPTAAVTVTARRFVPCGWPWSPTITVSPGGAVFSVCTGRSRHFTGDGSARADDDAAHPSPPGREPDEHRAGPSAQPSVGGRRGSVL
jgi:RNA polymerase sigma factor (sigma-70 family)